MRALTQTKKSTFLGLMKTISEISHLFEKLKNIIEPLLDELGGEAHLNISARGFWVAHQKAFFDVRVFNPLTRRYVAQI